ncbi:MAG: N-acetyl sugar amidotransferase [Afipia sp.]|nr:N-acetyl sugar amidotransferase [Afipia sp.]
MRYCATCILPDTRPNLVIGPNGKCNACESHVTKRNIDWSERRAAFESVVSHAKSRSKGYDCLIPVSGGKDSTWQVVKCLEAGLNPLAVTWKTPGRTAIGQRNLDNLVSLGVDHIDYQINPVVERKFIYDSFVRFGSTAIPMHTAIFAIPAKIAVRFQIPLIVWGENSAFEYGGREEERTGFSLNREWLSRHGVTHGMTAKDWISDRLTAAELTPYFGPEESELESAGISAVFLGYYFEWDPEKTRAVALSHGFTADSHGPRTGLYDYADIDDDFISIHHWLKWYKFGFTRLFDNLSLEIRNGRISRDEAIAVVRARGNETPVADIEKLCSFLGIGVARFFEISEGFRNHEIWFEEPGTWKIRDFLIPEWEWI